MQALEEQIKSLLIESLNLEDIAPADIEPEAALFGEGLGLDSIDALELGLALQRHFGVRFSNDSAETRRHFASIRTLAQFVAAHRHEPT